MKLQRDFYIGQDVTKIAKKLLGKALYTRFEGVLTAGIITETEAYCGRNDKACHANNNLRTNRTKVMYREGGKAYVYLCYGIHHLFNVVTNQEGLADAVLIRGIVPLEGREEMMERRGDIKNKSRLCAGPGTLTQALGIKTHHTGIDLLDDQIWIEDKKIAIEEKDIQLSKRIGVDYAGEDADRLWRFFIKNSALKI